MKVICPVAVTVYGKTQAHTIAPGQVVDLDLVVGHDPHTTLGDALGRIADLCTPVTPAPVKGQTRLASDDKE